MYLVISCFKWFLNKVRNFSKMRKPFKVLYLEGSLWAQLGSGLTVNKLSGG